jgi:hypothetical protein
MELAPFHYKNALFFKRNTDGSVTIRQMAKNHVDCKEIAFEVTIDQNGWASIVSSMSVKGESDGRFYKALEFHNEV